MPEIMADREIVDAGHDKRVGELQIFRAGGPVNHCHRTTPRPRGPRKGLDTYCRRISLNSADYSSRGFSGPSAHLRLQVAQRVVVTTGADVPQFPMSDFVGHSLHLPAARRAGLPDG